MINKYIAALLVVVRLGGGGRGDSSIPTRIPPARHTLSLSPGERGAERWEC